MYLTTFTFVREWEASLPTMLESERQYRSFGFYPSFSVRREKIKRGIDDRHHPLEEIWEHRVGIDDRETANETLIQERFYTLGENPEPEQAILDAPFHAVSLMHLRNREVNPMEAIRDLYAEWGRKKPEGIVGFDLSLTWDCTDICLRLFATQYQACLDCLGKLSECWGEEPTYSVDHVFSVVGFRPELCDGDELWTGRKEDLPTVLIWGNVEEFSEFKTLCDDIQATLYGEKAFIEGKVPSAAWREPEIAMGRDDACLILHDVSMKALVQKLYGEGSPLYPQKEKERTFTFRVSPQVGIPSVKAFTAPEASPGTQNCARNLRKIFCHAIKKKEWLENPDRLVMQCRAAILRLLDEMIQVEENAVSYDVFALVFPSMELLIRKILEMEDVEEDTEQKQEEMMKFFVRVQQYLRDLHTLLSHAQYADALLMQPQVSAPVIFDLPVRLCLFYAAFMFQVNKILHSDEKGQEQKKEQAFLVVPKLCRFAKLETIFRDREALSAEETLLTLESATVPAYGFYDPGRIMMELAHETAHRVDGGIVCRETRNKCLCRCVVEWVICQFEDEFGKGLKEDEVFEEKYILSFRETLNEQMYQDLCAALKGTLKEKTKSDTATLSNSRLEQLIPSLWIAMRMLLMGDGILRKYAIAIQDEHEELLQEIARKNSNWHSPLQTMREVAMALLVPATEGTRLIGPRLQVTDALSNVLGTVCHCLVECLADLLYLKAMKITSIEEYIRCMTSPHFAGGERIKDLDRAPDMAERVLVVIDLMIADQAFSQEEWDRLWEGPALDEKVAEFLDGLKKYCENIPLPRAMGSHLKYYLKQCLEKINPMLKVQAPEESEALQAVYQTIKAGNNLGAMVEKMQEVRLSYWNHCFGKGGLSERIQKQVEKLEAETK